MKRAIAPLVLLAACRSANDDAPRERSDRAWLALEGDTTDVGFGEPIAVDARAANAGARRGEIAWTQLAGPALTDVTTTDHGFHFSARTPHLADVAAVPWGVVPLSARTHSEVVLEAEWHGGRGTTPIRERITIALAFRARGLPNVPVHQRVYLGGSGWRITSPPGGSQASIEWRDGIATFTPDRSGTWTFTDDAQRSLRLQAGRYDDTPLDCGRAECHQAIARSAQETAMTWALARRIDGPHPNARDIACALACHATGEPGSHDGGFADVAAEITARAPFDGVHDIGELAQPLRRLGSVGCLACHGPGALPEADARWSILRADVCAYCHDAPPRYGHVAGWSTSAMARADRNPVARENTKCVGCHTTWGFLAQHPNARASAPSAVRKPPPAVGNLGIACAACHEVHGASDQRALLRDVPPPSVLSGIDGLDHSPSATCSACHAPDESGLLPQASASTLLWGRGGVDPRSGVPLVGPSPHARVEGGCTGCHDAGPTDLVRGANHAFAANPARCTGCHPKPALPNGAIAQQAQSLYNALLARRAIVRTPPSSAPLPPHATDVLAARATTPLARAAHNVALVLEDRAAAAHNPAYATQLLAVSRDVIERARP
jgi:NAD-dependent dihydropyrimidine dehydrogenase PreA subunit